MNITTAIFALLQSIKIIPSLKNNCVDRIAILLYITAEIAIAAYRLIFFVTWESSNISSIFNIIVNFVLYPIFIISSIFCNSYAIKHCRFLIEDQRLPAPKNLAYFAITKGFMSMLGILFLADNIFCFIKSGYLDHIFVPINVLIYFVVGVISFLGISVSAQHFCNNAEKTSITVKPKSAEVQVHALLDQYRAIKKAFGPQLLLIFTIKTIFIIFYSYRLFVGKQIYFVAIAVSELLGLDYIALVIEGINGAFKKTAQPLK